MNSPVSSLGALPRILSAFSCLLLLVSGCSQPKWDSPYREYLERLSRTLGQSYATPKPASPPRMPRPSEIHQKIESDHLDGLDFLALHGCELQLTIGKMNSSLGRMARDSQRLLLELEYLQLAPGCIAQLQTEGKHRLATRLQQAWNDKHRQLPRRVFNATLGADEYRELWQPAPPRDKYPDNTSAAPLQALGQINALVERWLGGDYRFNNRDFEILLSEVAKGDGGRLWYALTVQDNWLASANAVLHGRRGEAPLCADNYRADAADILPNVISRFFVDGTQSRAAKLGRRYHELSPLLLELEQLLAPALPEAYVSWKSDRDTQFTRLAAAPREHVAQLQLLQAPCNKTVR